MEFNLDMYWWIIICVCYLLIHSYLPSTIAASFCRGLSSSHTAAAAAAGGAFKRAEVCKWCPRCFRAGGDCRDDRNLQGNSGGPGLADVVNWPPSLRRAVSAWFTPWPVCLHTWRHRDRFTARKQKRLFLRTLRQTSTILSTSLFTRQYVAARHTDGDVYITILVPVFCQCHR